MIDHIKIGAGAVVIKDGKVLLTKRKGSHAAGHYGSFGGHVEHGETPIEACKREAREELGIEIDNLRFVSCTNMIKYGKHYIDISFVAEIASGVPTVMEPEKNELVDWFSLDNLPEPLFEPVRIVLEGITSGRQYFEVNE